MRLRHAGLGLTFALALGSFEATVGCVLVK